MIETDLLNFRGGEKTQCSLIFRRLDRAWIGVRAAPRERQYWAMSPPV
jgi:hypothetical protein